MNYKKVYDAFIEYCLNTDINERLKNRNHDDFRIGREYLYTENHHIVPKHTNGKDVKANMVLLPEEHIFAHKIRWKAYKQRGDMLVVRFCLNGIINPKCKQLNEISMMLSRTVRNGYIWMKQNSAEVRKTHGWQTPEGVQRISEARKGQIPVKDVNTGEMMGCVTKDHPKYISGELVHHSKGIKLSKEEAQNKASPGEKNGKYNGTTDEEIIEVAVKLALKHKQILSQRQLRVEAKELGVNIPACYSKFRFNGNGGVELNRIIREKTGFEYNPYAKSDTKRKNIKHTKGKK
jgi:hypothetical protein